MLTDDGASRRLAPRRVGVRLCLALMISACGIGGCSSSGGSASSPGLLGNLRRNPDPGVRYVAYAKGGNRDVFGHRPGMRDAIAARAKQYWEGPSLGTRLRNFSFKRKNGLP